MPMSQPTERGWHISILSNYASWNSAPEKLRHWNPMRDRHDGRRKVIALRISFRRPDRNQRMMAFQPSSTPTAADGEL